MQYITQLRISRSIPYSLFPIAYSLLTPHAPSRMQKRHLTKEQALQKIRQYCAYQERSHAEVVSKLWDLGVYRSDHDEILASLIEDDYLNESRFAEAFVGGHFRMKDWGRKKIYYGLKEKKVSEYIIKKAMQTIDEEAYLKTLRSLAEKKYELLKGEQYLVRKKKTQDYLLQKGYELNLISAAIATLTGGG
jgi:regulatory protein